MRSPIQITALAALFCLLSACGAEEDRPQGPQLGDTLGGGRPPLFGGGPQPVDIPNDINDMDPDADMDEPTFDPEAPPAASAELFEYLREGAYTSLRSHSAIQQSDIHVRVRTFMNDRLHRSLAAAEGDDDFIEHPIGSAAIKAIYDGDDALTGWAVMIKVANSDGLDSLGWYWYENLSTTRNTPEVAEVGSPLCSTCHAQGADFVITALPLR